MTQKQTSKQQLEIMGKLIRKHKRIIAVVIVALALVAEMTYFGNISYASKWVSCSQRPVMYEQWSPMISFGVTAGTIRITAKPGFFDEKTTLFSKEKRFYCTLEQAVEHANSVPYAEVSIIK